MQCLRVVALLEASGVLDGMLCAPLPATTVIKTAVLLLFLSLSFFLFLSLSFFPSFLSLSLSHSPSPSLSPSLPLRLSLSIRPSYLSLAQIFVQLIDTANSNSIIEWKQGVEEEEEVEYG